MENLNEGNKAKKRANFMKKALDVHSFNFFYEAPASSNSTSSSPKR